MKKRKLKFNIQFEYLLLHILMVGRGGGRVIGHIITYYFTTADSGSGIAVLRGGIDMLQQMQLHNHYE